MLKKYFSIFLKNILIFLAGAAAGYLFFYFFKDASVFIMDKFKFIQNIFGIRQYQEGMSFSYVFAAVFFGNLLSTIGFFALGFLRASLPVSFITGIFMILFLFTGTVRHGIPVPMEVFLLTSIEMFYRVVALATGEYINRYRFQNKIIPLVSLAVIFVMFIAGVFYELYQLF